MNKQIVPVVTTVALVVVAFVFAVLGFVQAPNSQVAPAAVSGTMIVSALIFAAAAVSGLRRSETWQRFLGVVAATGAIYMVVMAVLYFRALRVIHPDL